HNGFTRQCEIGSRIASWGRKIQVVLVFALIEDAGDFSHEEQDNWYGDRRQGLAISSTQVSVCDTKEQPPPPALRPSPSAPGLGLGPVRALRGGVNSPAACPSGVSDQESGVSRLLFLRGFLNLDAWVFLQRLERLPELGGFLLFTSRIVQVDKPLNQIGELVLADWR